MSEEKLDIIASQVNLLVNDVGELKSDVGQLKTDVSQLKLDVGQLASIQDKMLIAMIDLQEHAKRTDVRLERLEVNQERTFEKLDGFMTIFNRHESEIAAVRSKMERLESSR